MISNGPPSPPSPNIMPEFSIQAPYELNGDQPTAIVGEASSLHPKDVTLTQLRESFGLVLELDDLFFREWQDDVPELEAEASTALEEVKVDFLHLSRYDLLEPIVKMVVLSPIL
jgi:hypothetical protein